MLLWFPVRRIGPQSRPNYPASEFQSNNSQPWYSPSAAGFSSFLLGCCSARLPSNSFHKLQFWQTNWHRYWWNFRERLLRAVFNWLNLQVGEQQVSEEHPRRTCLRYRSLLYLQQTADLIRSSGPKLRTICFALMPRIKMLVRGIQEVHWTGLIPKLVERISWESQASGSVAQNSIPLGSIQK